jgi:hypothetical protein
MVAGKSSVGVLVFVGEAEGVGVFVDTGLVGKTEGVGVVVAAGLPIKINPIAKEINRIVPITKNTSKIITSPERPAGGEEIRFVSFSIFTVVYTTLFYNHFDKNPYHYHYWHVTSALVKPYSTILMGFL